MAEGSRVIIYGAGEVGTAFKEQIDMDDSFTLVTWIDKRYEHYRSLGLNVDGIEKIKKVQFDYLLIAIKNQKVVEAVREELLDLRIDESKIIGYGS